MAGEIERSQILRQILFVFIYTMFFVVNKEHKDVTDSKALYINRSGGRVGDHL